MREIYVVGEPNYYWKLKNTDSRSKYLTSFKNIVTGQLDGIEFNATGIAWRPL